MSGEILILSTVFVTAVASFACLIKARLASLHDETMILKVI